MATTYLQLVNQILREMNEVELTSSNFSAARGVHGKAKDAVNTAIREIGTYHYSWPFLAAEHTQTLVTGTFEYAWPTSFKAVDWHSFQIQKDTNLGIQNPQTLKPVERDQWYRYAYDEDREDTTNGRGVPKYVFQTHGDGFGISPNPDNTYELKFRYYKYTTELSAFDDEMDIPDQFKHVVTLGAARHLYRMLDGLQYAAEVRDSEYKKALTAMRTLLINDDKYMSSTMITGRGSANWYGVIDV